MQEAPKRGREPRRPNTGRARARRATRARIRRARARRGSNAGSLRHVNKVEGGGLFRV